MPRMTEERWKIIWKRREFVGVTLHDEMITARKADLKYIAELEAELLEVDDDAIGDLHFTIKELESQINACNYFLKQAGLGVDIPAHLIKLEAQIEAVKALPGKWREAAHSIPMFNDPDNFHAGLNCADELDKALEKK